MPVAVGERAEGERAARAARVVAAMVCEGLEVFAALGVGPDGVVRLVGTTVMRRITDDEYEALRASVLAALDDLRDKPLDDLTVIT